MRSHRFGSINGFEHIFLLFFSKSLWTVNDLNHYYGMAMDEVERSILSFVK